MTHDVRMVAPAVAAWAVALAAVHLDPRVAAASAAVAGLAGVALAFNAPGGWPLVAATSLLVVGVVAGVAAVRVAAIASNPVAEAALAGRFATLTAQVTSDPRAPREALTPTTYFRATVLTSQTRGSQVALRAPILVFTARPTDDVVVGSRVVLRGSLRAPDSSDLSAVLSARTVRLLPATPWWWSASDTLRDAVDRASSRGPPSSRALVPALVHGDDSGLRPELVDDFQRSGLTHLLAVSGTNLTIVLAVVLAAGRLGGVRGRGQWVLGGVAVVGFVVLARPEPSVLRAAVMGVIGLAALGHQRGRGGLRALSWAVVVLLLLDPWLGSRAGFALSVCATAGIVVLTPAWSAALSRWMPRWAALALAVPLAAQLACTPIVAALSGEVSLVAVLANLAAAPLVAPATVLGLAGGAVGLVVPEAGSWAGGLAALFTHAIATIAHASSQLPGASATWSSPVWLLVVVCVVLALLMRRLLTHPLLVGGACAVLVVALWHPPSPGWPPRGWFMVVCDVGQGDATVLNAGPGSAVVVDAGIAPRPVRRCLDRLGVEHVPLLVFSHSDADHVDGWRGVTAGRRVDTVGVGPSGGPEVPGAERLSLVQGARYRVGELSWTVEAPGLARAASANDASVVMLVEVRGVRILLTGDVEHAAQAALLRDAHDLRADVLKVPHHGSATQDPRLFDAVGARFATFSAGRDNPYGHPAPSTLALARSRHMTVLRTDVSGDIALVVRDDVVSAWGS